MLSIEDRRLQQVSYRPVYLIVDFFHSSPNLIVEIEGPCQDAEEDRRNFSRRPAASTRAGSRTKRC
jgi:hypothetical protein